MNCPSEKYSLQKEQEINESIKVKIIGLTLEAPGYHKSQVN